LPISSVSRLVSDIAQEGTLPRGQSGGRDR
jgi:hypothetical protein